MLRGLASYVPFLGRFLAEEEEKEVAHLEPARVAVVGAGVGGCLAAYFLREKGGEALKVDVFERGEVGGRSATFVFQGHVRETGAVFMHTCQKYLSDLRKEFGLETRHIASVPVGVYNGKEFLFRTGWWKLINIVRCVLRYGTSLLTIYSSVTSVLNQISNIYSLQSRGEVYHTVPDMLRAMGGEELYHLTQISAKQYLQQELRLQETLMNEVITAAIYTYCGQGLEEVNACTCMVSLNGIQRENIWSVVGGNCLIPQTALVRSGAELYKCSVTSITRTVGDGGRVSYSIQTDESGEQASEMGEYDAVIVATPLYEQSIQFKNFPTPVYTEEITATMYQRSVMEFVDGEVNPAFFGLEDNDRTFPLIILSCDFVEGSPAFCSFGKSMVAGASDSELEKYNKPMPEEPSRVWKLHTPQPLTREEKQQMFKKINAEATVDWLAFPKCSPPESFPPFELDTGVFYVNGIEKAASIMEMSAIAAKNCALLARQYLKNK